MKIADKIKAKRL